MTPSNTSGPSGRSPKSALANLLDMAVFAPLGVAVSVVRQAPEWLEKGREEMFRQLDVARVVGEHASRHGQKRLMVALVDMGLLPGPQPPPTAPRSAASAGAADDPEARGPLVGHRSGKGKVGKGAARREVPAPERQRSPVADGDGAAASPASTPTGPVADSAGEAVGPGTSAPAPLEPSAGGVERSPEPPERVADGGPAGADLAIPGYDSLSAFQVVQRLAGLAPEELESVRRYEAARRGRRTILTRVSQLQTGRP